MLIKKNKLRKCPLRYSHLQKCFLNSHHVEKNSLRSPPSFLHMQLVAWKQKISNERETRPISFCSKLKLTLTLQKWQDEQKMTVCSDVKSKYLDNPTRLSTLIISVSFCIHFECINKNKKNYFQYTNGLFLVISFPLPQKIVQSPVCICFRIHNTFWIDIEN